MKQILTVRIEANNRLELSKALEQLANTLKETITLIGQGGFVPSQPQVTWTWHINQPMIDYGNIQQLFDNGIIDAEEKEILEQVNSETIKAAIIKGSPALKKLIIQNTTFNS